MYRHVVRRVASSLLHLLLEGYLDTAEIWLTLPLLKIDPVIELAPQLRQREKLGKK